MTTPAASGSPPGRPGRTQCRPPTPGRRAGAGSRRRHRSSGSRPAHRAAPAPPGSALRACERGWTRGPTRRRSRAGAAAAGTGTRARGKPPNEQRNDCADAPVASKIRFEQFGHPARRAPNRAGGILAHLDGPARRGPRPLRRRASPPRRNRQRVDAPRLEGRIGGVPGPERATRPLTPLGPPVKIAGIPARHFGAARNEDLRQSVATCAIAAPLRHAPGRFASSGCTWAIQRTHCGDGVDERSGWREGPDGGRGGIRGAAPGTRRRRQGPARVPKRRCRGSRGHRRPAAGGHRRDLLIEYLHRLQDAHGALREGHLAHSPGRCDSLWPRSTRLRASITTSTSSPTTRRWRRARCACARG